MQQTPEPRGSRLDQGFQTLRVFFRPDFVPHRAHRALAKADLISASRFLPLIVRNAPTCKGVIPLS
jgi:hypothetical protein